MQVPISLIYLKSNVEDVQFLLQSSKQHRLNMSKMDSKRQKDQLATETEKDLKDTKGKGARIFSVVDR